MGSNAFAFKEWAQKENVAVSGSITELRNVRVGIDADDYVNTILVSRSREPLLPALGGLPFGLFKRIKDDLENFRNAEIEPVFLFGGLDLACRDKTMMLRESRKAGTALNGAWSIYDRNDGERAVIAFGDSITYRTEHIMRSVHFFLHKQGVFCQTAPHNAAPQLAYMERENYVDAVVGSASCLIFGVEKVITGFEWSDKGVEHSTFTWVSVSRCLTKLGVTQDQFVCICLLSGSSILATSPEIDVESRDSKIVPARNFVSRAGHDASTLALSIKDEHYRELFMKAYFVTKHPIIVTEDGKIEPVDLETAPADCHEFNGQRLPDEFMAYLVYGLIGPRMLNWRSRKEILETQPLDGGDHEAYKRLVQDKLRPLRAQGFSLINRHLHRYFQKLDLDLVCFWNEDAKLPLNIPDQPQYHEAADNWHIKSKALGSQARADACKTPLAFAINFVADEAVAKKTVTPQPTKGPPLREPEELTVNTVCRFLEQRGYIKSDHTLSGWGKAFNVALDRAASDNLQQYALTDSEIEEAIFMAFELIRLDALNSTNLFPNYSGEPYKVPDAEKWKMVLLSRVACLASFHHGEIGYSGPLSRQLLAFHQMAAATRRTLRDLIEMHAANMFMANSVDRRLKKKEYKDLGASLPLLDEPNLGFGLLVKTVTEHMEDSEKRSSLATSFLHAQDIERDVEKAWKLWDAVNAGVQSAESGLISAATKGMFKSADEWLARKRNEPLQVTAAAPNGVAANGST